MLGLGSAVLDSICGSNNNLSFVTPPTPLSNRNIKQGRPSHTVIISMGLVGANRKSPNDAPLEILTQ